MAFGDQEYCAQLHLMLLPDGWFPETAQVAPALVQGGASANAWAFSFLSYVKSQDRVETAMAEFLDLAGFDYFGTKLPRLQGESDQNYMPRVKEELIRPRNTRAAIIKAVQDITGVTPTLIEPWNPNDTGGWGVYQRLGYGVAGAWGSYYLPFQSFLIVPPFLKITGSSGMSGWGSPQGGWGSAVGGRMGYSNPSLVTGQVTDAVLYQAIENVREANTVIWVKLLGG